MENFRKLIGDILLNKHPLLSCVDKRVERSMVFQRLAISHKSKYCCFRIPKCANSTIVLNLVYYDPNLNYYNANKSNDKPVSEQFKKKFDNTSFKTLIMLKFPDDYYLFTFVRNPYVRILSAYLDKIEDKQKRKQGVSQYEFVRKFILKNSSEKKLTFDGFVSYLEKGGLYKNAHWLPQLSILPVKKEKLSFIGKVENIKNDLPKVIDTLFGNGTFEEAKIKKEGRTSSVNLVEKYYTKELAERVYKLYKKDFEAFDYSKKLPRK